MAFGSISIDQQAKFVLVLTYVVVKVVAIFLYPAVAHILAHSVNLVFGPKSGFENECRAGFELVISGSRRVRTSK